MEMAIFLIGSIISTILEVTFLTIFYKIKYPIKRYKTMLATMLCTVILFAAVCNYFNLMLTYRQVIQFIVLSLILFLFTKDKFSPVYMIFPYVLLIIVDVFIQDLMTVNSQSLIVSVVFKLALILLARQDMDYVVKFKFNSISLKMIIFMFVFILLLLGHYTLKNFIQ